MAGTDTIAGPKLLRFGDACPVHKRAVFADAIVNGSSSVCAFEVQVLARQPFVFDMEVVHPRPSNGDAIPSESILPGRSVPLPDDQLAWHRSSPLIRSYRRGC